MNLADQIQAKRAEIALAQSNIASCERALEHGDQFGAQPFVHSINWLGVRSGKSGAVTVHNGIAIQAITLQLEAHKNNLAMLEKELQDLINSNQF